MGTEVEVTSGGPNLSHGKFTAKLEDDTIWLMENGELEWVFRYGDPDRKDLLWAAAILSEFRALIRKPVRRRNEVMRHLRTALDLVWEPGEGDQPAEEK